MTIKADDLIGNVQRANEFESKRQIAKIDKPLDRKEWGMTPPEVNAYYSGSFNEIVFPAGILQPPFFDKSMDDAVNFGGIGLVIGHELTHGFDDQGRKFDPTGNLRDWWTEQDGKEFEKRVSCVADEYSNFVAVDNMKLNGRLTLRREYGGQRRGAHRARRAGAHDCRGQDREGRAEASTATRRSRGSSWDLAGCGARSSGRNICACRSARIRILQGKYRVNGVVQNMPEFQKAWNCKAGQPMVAENACHVW